VRILDEHARIIAEEPVAIESQGQRLELTLKDAALHTPRPRFRSTSCAKPPLSPKELRALAKAEAEARAGDHAKAVEDLRRAHQSVHRSVCTRAPGPRISAAQSASDAVPELRKLRVLSARHRYSQ